MASLHVDTVRLERTAVRLEDTVRQLTEHEAKVTSIAQELLPAWTGEAGREMQKALADYTEAVADLGREQTEILGKVYSATMHYARTDAAGAGSLADEMHI